MVYSALLFNFIGEERKTPQGIPFFANRQELVPVVTGGVKEKELMPLDFRTCNLFTKFLVLFY